MRGYEKDLYEKIELSCFEIQVILLALDELDINIAKEPDKSKLWLTRENVKDTMKAFRLCKIYNK